MKNILMMSAAAIVTAGAASADVNLSGYGRFGLTYNDGVPAGIAQTQIDTRFRLNIDASMTSDVGVEFGGRVRLQYDDNSATSVLTSTPTATGGVVNTTTTTGSGAQLSPADLYAKFGGLRVDVGNVGTAFDNAALMYNSEVGYIGNSSGDPLGSFYAFASGPYNANQVNRMGVAVAYSFGAANVRASIVNPNQQLDGLPGGQDIEYGISGDYGFGAFTVSAAYVANGAGITDNDNYYIAAEYAINDAGTVGLQYFDDGDTSFNTPGDEGEHYTLYGSYVFGQITAKAYVAQRQGGAGDDTAYGIGADYDLGGALLAVSVREDYDSNTLADFGVKFNF